MVFKYAFGLFISLHHDSLGSSFFHGGEFFFSRRIFFSLTELTDLTDLICAQFRAHRTPSAYRYHRAFQLKMAVRFCGIG